MLRVTVVPIANKCCRHAIMQSCLAMRGQVTSQKELIHNSYSQRLQTTYRRSIAIARARPKRSNHIASKPNMTKDNATLLSEFKDLVNMSKGELQQWLETSESLHTGMKREGEDEAVGHKSGRYIVELLSKSEDDYTEDDYHQISRVVAYIKRHLAQRPEKSDEELEGTKWVNSLRNWGHDPLKA